MICFYSVQKGQIPNLWMFTHVTVVLEIWTLTLFAWNDSVLLLGNTRIDESRGKDNDNDKYNWQWRKDLLYVCNLNLLLSIQVVCILK